MSADAIKIVNAEALIVGPDEVLIIRLPEQDDPAFLADAMEALGRAGLDGRCVVITGDAELTKVERTS